LDAAATTRQRKRRHRVWVNKYLQRRAQYGTYNSLMIDLLELDDAKFCNYVRMPPEEFNTLFSSQVRHQHQLSDWLCDATSPQQIESKLHCFDLLWICCGLGFVVQQKINPQHLDMSRCCGFVVGDRFVVDLL